MDFVKFSSTMTMLDLIRYLLQETANSFSFYSGKLSKDFELEDNFNYHSQLTSLCHYICRKVREEWSIHNIGIVSNKTGEMMICVTSADPSLPAEIVSVMVEAVAVCFPNHPKEQFKQTTSTDEVEHMDDDDMTIPPDLIQVNGTMKEIQERIKKFINQKKEQSNMNNIVDFCGPSSQLCARVDAVLVRKKNSSSHMSVRNVLDRYTSKQNSCTDQKSSNLINQQPTSSSIKGEKRTFDNSSAGIELEGLRKQQKTVF